MDASEHTGVAIMAMLSKESAKRLVVPGASEPESNLHVTVAFLKQEAADVSLSARAQLQVLLRYIAQTNLPLTASISARAEFSFANPVGAEHEPCSVYLVSSPELLKVHEMTCAAINELSSIDEDDTFPIWTPHVTIGYGLPVTDLNQTGTIALDRLVVSWAGNIVTL